MANFNIDLSKVKKEHLLIGGVALIVIILLLAFFNIFKPLLGKSKDADLQIVQKQNTIERAKVGPEAAKTLEKELIQIRSELALYQDKLQDAVGVPKILRELNQIAERQKIKFVSVTPSSERKMSLPGDKEYLLQIPIRINLQCGYHELGIFINQIENFSRLMKITDIKITANPQDIWSHHVELAISSYSLVSTKESKGK